MKKKVKIVLLGYSNIAKKRILPALKNHPHIFLVGIASRSSYHKIPKIYKSYDNYKDAISQSDCDVVYISLHNSAHFKWIKYALLWGKHVICDKPAVLTASQAKECYILAGKNLLIYESIPFILHKQHKFIKKFISDQTSPIQSITAHLGFTVNDPTNYRMFPKLGGGCIYDIGPNLISAGCFYFESFPKEIISFTNFQKGLPVSSATMMRFKNGGTLQCLFGYQYEYKNQLELWGETHHIWLQNVFSVPKELENIVHCKVKDKIKTYKIPNEDCFYSLFSDFYRWLHLGQFKKFNQVFVNQATALDALNKSANTNQKIIVNYIK